VEDGGWNFLDQEGGSDAEGDEDESEGDGAHAPPPPPRPRPHRPTLPVTRDGRR